MKKVQKFVQEYRTPKRTLARMIGVNETALYFYLNPQKYGDRGISDAVLQKIAQFEGVSVAAVRRDYETRRAA